MKKFLILFTGFTALMIVVGLGAAAGLYYWAGRQLPDYTSIADYRPIGVTHVLARDGALMGQLYREKRFPLTFEQIPERLRLSFLAVEDADFYNHEGVNPVAILRAFIMNLQSGKTTQGGSTITQQLIKSLLLTPERKYKRKIQEAILAYRLEKYLTKNEILTIYLNHIFLGSNSYGVEAAARTFFGKHVSELTWAECALIAGLPQAPSAYNPYRFPDVAKARQRHVLFRLRECNWITEAQYTEALAQPLVYTNLTEGMGPETAWYFEEVRRRLIDLLSEDNAKKHGITLPKYGADAVYELGLTVRTAMNLPQQAAADQALRKGLEDLSKRQGWLGPVTRIPAEYVNAHIQTAVFAPPHLAHEAWAKAIVVKVDEKGADVRLGAYKGFISVKNMSWARIPNPEVAGVHAAAIKDARKVLAVGDEIWVSARPKSNNQPYTPAEVTPDTVIDLALEQRPDVQGALVSIEPQTGDVVALVGGYDFAESQFNRATQAVRQPGSSFKPIVYSAAMDNGFTAGSIVLDAPVVQLSENIDQIWRPTNYSNDFEGPILLRTALAKSRNLCTIRVAQQVGMAKIVERARALGLEGDFPPVLAISLGAGAVSPLNLTQAYTAFADHGLVSTPRMIVEIRDGSGKVIYAQEPQLREAISPQNAYIMAALLKDVVNAGTATKAKVLGRPIAGKTGTTNDEMDAWFVGLTPHLVTGVFVGYDKLKTLGRLETGGSAALPIFVDYGKKVLDAYPPDDFPVPDGIVMAKVDPKSGLLVGEGEPGFVLPFMAGTVPVRTASNSSAAGAKSGEDLLKQLY